MVLVTDWAGTLVAGRTREVPAEALLREKECRATVAAMERFVLVGLPVTDEKIGGKRAARSPTRLPARPKATIKGELEKGLHTSLQAATHAKEVFTPTRHGGVFL